MRRYRRRPSSRKVEVKKAIGLFVLATGCIGYLFLAGRLGVAVGNLVTPMLANNEKSQTVQAMEQGDQIEIPKATTLPKATVMPTVNESQQKKVTEAINIEAQTLYCVQIGAFSDKENAEIAAVTLRKRGAAGYLLEEKYWRVMAAGYLNREDALKVKDQLEESGIENTLYNIAYSRLSFDITADEEVMKEIKLLFETYQECMSIMHETAMQLDEGKITQDEGLIRIQNIKTQMEASSLIMQKMIEKLSGDNAVLSNLFQAYETSIEKMQKIINSKSLTKVELSSILKYNYIDMFLEFKTYMDQF